MSMMWVPRRGCIVLTWSLAEERVFFQFFGDVLWAKANLWEISLSIQLGMLWNQAETVDPYCILQRFEDVGQELIQHVLPALLLERAWGWYVKPWVIELPLLLDVVCHLLAMFLGIKSPRKSCLATLDERANMLNPNLRVSCKLVQEHHDATCV